MKKSLALILALLMAAAVTLCSCADTKSPENTDDTAVNSSNAESTVPDTGAYSVVTQYSMIYPELDTDDVINDSVLIVRAKLKDTLAPTERYNLVYTDHVFEIEEVFFGDKSVGDEITVEFIGGMLDGIEYVMPDAISVPENGEVIMILGYPTDENDEVTTTDRYTFFPPKGVLNLTDDISDDGSAIYEASDTSVRFTVNDLVDTITRVKG